MEFCEQASAPEGAVGSSRSTTVVSTSSSVGTVPLVAMAARGCSASCKNPLELAATTMAVESVSDGVAAGAVSESIASGEPSSSSGIGAAAGSSSSSSAASPDVDASARPVCSSISLNPEGGAPALSAASLRAASRCSGVFFARIAVADALACCCVSLALSVCHLASLTINAWSVYRLRDDCANQLHPLYAATRTTIFMKATLSSVFSSSVRVEERFRASYMSLNCPISSGDGAFLRMASPSSSISSSVGLPTAGRLNTIWRSNSQYALTMREVASLDRGAERSATT